MVFASNIFILFMALMLPVFALATRWNPKSGKPLLIALSLFFYSYWLPIYLLLILGSMAVNYAIGVWAIRPADQRKRKIAVTLGIAANLILLGYFKYYGFFVENIQTLLGIQGDVPRIALPLGISFFTFQQISFLIEVYRRHVDRVDLTNYVLFSLPNSLADA